MKRFCVLTAIIAAFTLGAKGHAQVPPNGTWTSSQSVVYQTSVQQPINADGSSNFKANGKAVIPVKFAFGSGVSPFVFESIGTDNPGVTANDFSFVSFTPTSPTTFADIAELSAVYAFTLGDCHGGSLRWSVRTSATESLFIYYGNPPQFGAGSGGCTSSANGGVNQSGTNLIGFADFRYDTSQYAGGTFYDTYANAKAILGSTPIIRASLLLDSGWGGDQRLTLTSATFATAAYADTFTPLPGSALIAKCPTDPATIKIVKTAGTPSGDVNEPVTVQPQDNDGYFRIVDCKYMYNLATSSLSGVGQYKVSAVINGIEATPPAVFDLK